MSGHLGLEQLGGGQGVDQGMMARVDRQAISRPAVIEANGCWRLADPALETRQQRLAMPMGLQGHGVDDREHQPLPPTVLNGGIQEGTLDVPEVHHHQPSRQGLEQLVEDLVERFLPG